MHSGPFSGCGEFRLRDSEAVYRDEHLPEFSHHCQLTFRYAAIVNLLFVFSDCRFYPQAHFYFAISARAVIEIASLVCLAADTRVKTYRHLVGLCTAWACLVIPASAVLMSHHTDIALLVAFILPAIFYLLLPMPCRWTLSAGLSCSTLTLTVYMSSQPFSISSLGLIAGMLMANAALMLVLIKSNRLRRLEWAATRAQRRANVEISERRDMLQKIFKATPFPLLITTKDSGGLILANDSAYDYFGEDLQKDSFQIESCFDPGDWTKLSLKLEADNQVAEFEAQLRLPGGSARNVLVAATEMVVAGADALLTVFVDITHRKEAEAMMKKLARTDSLTGLPNRARFFSVAVREIRRTHRYNRPLSVFMVDIDSFKQINDTHGHNIGDKVLKSFANVCRTWVRSQDHVGRLGGDEFGFLLPETDTANALVLAERLRLTVGSQQIDGLLAPITVSIGVSEVLPGETSVDAALSRADSAMYTAKRSGRNSVALYGQSEFTTSAPHPE